MFQFHKHIFQNGLKPPAAFALWSLQRQSLKTWMSCWFTDHPWDVGMHCCPPWNGEDVWSLGRKWKSSNLYFCQDERWISCKILLIEWCVNSHFLNQKEDGGLLVLDRGLEQFWRTWGVHPWVSLFRLSKDLLFEVQERIRPQFCVFGHIHEGAGVTWTNVFVCPCPVRVLKWI